MIETISPKKLENQMTIRENKAIREKNRKKKTKCYIINYSWLGPHHRHTLLIHNWNRMYNTLVVRNFFVKKKLIFCIFLFHKYRNDIWLLFISADQMENSVRKYFDYLLQAAIINENAINFWKPKFSLLTLFSVREQLNTI